MHMTPSNPKPDLELTQNSALNDALRTSSRILRAIIVGVVILYFCSGIVIVPQDEVAVKLRFGKVTGAGAEQILGPGMHWAFPYPVDEVVRIPATSLQSVDTEEDFWYGLTSEEKVSKRENPPGPSLRPGFDGYLLTGDANLVHARVRLNYKISDPVRYALELNSPKDLLRCALDRAMIHVAASSSIESLRTRRNDAEASLLKLLRDNLDLVNAGISVEGVQFPENIIPPRQVQDAFNDVLSAEQEKSQKINEAKGFSNRVIEEARGEASRLISNAESYRFATVSEMQSASEVFMKIYDEYKKNPGIVVDTKFQDTIRNFILKAEDRTLLRPKRDGEKQEVRILISRDPVRPNPNQ